MNENENNLNEIPYLKTSREHHRIVFAKTKRPELIINEKRFEVLDISQRGLRFATPENIHLPKYIKGKLRFANGDEIMVEGLGKWRAKGLYGLRLKDPVPHEVILKQKSATAGAPVEGQGPEGD